MQHYLNIGLPVRSAGDITHNCKMRKVKVLHHQGHQCSRQAELGLQGLNEGGESYFAQAARLWQLLWGQTMLHLLQEEKWKDEKMKRQRKC